MSRLDPAIRAAAYGPGLGDLVALGDTGLLVRVDQDDRLSVSGGGDELLVGFGKTGRDGIGMRSVRTNQSCDVAITNVLLIDPVLGVRATTIGIREGRIAAIGKAGNPDTTDGIEVILGSGTVVISGEGLIATPGGVDTHVHLLSPRVLAAELSSGMTTVIGQEIGPFWGVGVGSAWTLRTGYGAFDAYPINVGILGRGSSSRIDPLLEAIEAGVCGFKVHEDTGAGARTLDTALQVAEEYDVQVALHTDGLNESLSVADTLAVVDGRTIHAYHVEGCGGGHVPDVLSLAGVANVLASSTNPTLPFGRDAVAEHGAMIAFAHGLRMDLPGEDQLARDRVRAATMSAETALHDTGVIAITSSDAQGMGRAGETWRRTMALAGLAAGRDPEREPRTGDNARVLRYVAKVTVNPAIAHGLSHEVGSLQPGRLADIVLWKPSMFGAKPTLVIKCGLPAWGAVGDPNATIDAAQPLVLAEQFGGIGATAAELSVLFVNNAAFASSTASQQSTAALGSTRRRAVAVRHCRGVGLGDLVGAATGEVRVDARLATVTLNGRAIGAPAADQVPLSRLYYL